MAKGYDIETLKSLANQVQGVTMNPIAPDTKEGPSKVSIIIPDMYMQTTIPGFIKSGNISSDFLPQYILENKEWVPCLESKGFFAYLIVKLNEELDKSKDKIIVISKLITQASDAIETANAIQITKELAIEKALSPTYCDQILDILFGEENGLNQRLIEYKEHIPAIMDDLLNHYTFYTELVGEELINSFKETLLTQ